LDFSRLHSAVKRKREQAGGDNDPKWGHKFGAEFPRFHTSNSFQLFSTVWFGSALRIFKNPNKIKEFGRKVIHRLVPSSSQSSSQFSLSDRPVFLDPVRLAALDFEQLERQWELL